MNSRKTVRELKVLIVDDEEFACLNLQKTLTKYIDESISVVDIAHDTAEAEDMIKLYQPDVVFFDVEMPNENAFSFLERMGHVNYVIIFVTAYDEYAIRAFRLNAADYILKPISVEEVTEAVKKAKERLAYRAIAPANNASVASPLRESIRLKINNGYEIVAFADITHLEAKGSYTAVYFNTVAGTQSTLLSNTLNDCEELLPPGTFFRIHRSYIVNHTHLEKILSDKGFVVVMKNRELLPVSRRRVPALMAFFKNSNLR